MGKEWGEMSNFNPCRFCGNKDLTFGETNRTDKTGTCHSPKYVSCPCGNSSSLKNGDRVWNYTNSLDEAFEQWNKENPKPTKKKREGEK